MTDSPLQHAEAIFRAGLARVDPLAMMARTLRLEGRVLVVETEGNRAAFDLDRFRTLTVTGMGKASARMALGLERLLGDRIDGGLVAVKSGHVEPLARIRLLEAAHPVPDATSVQAAEAILALAAGCDADTLAISLISGGGSAITCAPSPGLSLDDKQDVTRLLLGCGATIHELNAVRKHLSRIKGGRLARAFAPATCLSLLLSDVVGDDLDIIASGPTVADPSSFAEALAILGRYRLEDRIPRNALDLLLEGAAGKREETAKPGDPCLARMHNVLLGTNHQALLSAERKAQELGYHTLVLTARLAGEAREAAQLLLGIAEDIATRGFPLARPACLIAGGETTVTLRGSGKGGRNQEMALAWLDAMRRSPASRDLTLLAASTDGNDGPTDAAGAFASHGILRRALALGLDPHAYLADNDSYAFHAGAGSLLKTGPTNTNVSDMAILLVP
jgi:hydroxypyruvate reductase